MKKYALAAAVMAVVSGNAFAADMAIKAPPPAGFNWSGFYVGGHAGYGWGNTDITDNNVIGFLFGTPPLQKFSGNGFVGGLQAGANYQIGKLVIGTEYEISWTGTNNANSVGFVGIAGAGVATRTSNAQWIGTATTRIGFAAWDRTLVYSKAGVAYANYSFTDTVTIPGVAFAYNSSANDNRIGWTVGTGIEWAIADKWSAKVEYDYMDFGRRTVGFAPFVLGGLAVPVALDVNQRISVIKLGVNYALGGL